MIIMKIMLHITCYIKLVVSCLTLVSLCGGEIFRFALLQPVHSVCISLSAFFIGIEFHLAYNEFKQISVIDHSLVM